MISGINTNLKSALFALFDEHPNMYFVEAVVGGLVPGTKKPDVVTGRVNELSESGSRRPF